MKRPIQIRRRVVVIMLFAVFSGIAWYLWARFVAPTRIALIKFTDSQYAEFVDAKDNPFIRLDRIDADKLSGTDLGSYDVVFMFGMGLHLDDSQKAAITGGIARGAKVHVTSATSADSDLSNLTGDNLAYVEDAFSNGGRANTRALFNYCRRVLDRKTLFSEPVAEIREIPQDAFYHSSDDACFTSYDEYQRFYEESGRYHENRPRVCFITSMIGAVSIDRSYADDIIRLLEEKDINVYPIGGFMKRLEFMAAVDPDLVVCVPHGRLVPGSPDTTLAWLAAQNIPLLCPIDASEPYDDWVSSQQGIVGGMFSQSVVMTELDGGIEPLVIGADFPDENGLMASAGIPERVDRFVSRVERWLDLAAKPNADKKIAIVYYKGHGRNALEASGMNVASSLLNVLRRLRDAGYETGALPESGEELAAMIQTHGPVLGAYAQGAFSEFLGTGDPELIPTGTYLSWVERRITPEAYDDVVRAYGEAPGNYLTVARNDSSYIALPRLVFGNVALVPQLLPGIGDDTDTLVHGVKAAPPHPYIAEYLWIRYGFGADAIMHFGTHGSLEFTPWKQTALSGNDWPDALIGDLPHPYVYVIDNIGEALIAKRRSYAAIVSHLTPPFVESDLYGGLSRLDEAVEGYESSDDGALRGACLETIRTLIDELDLYRDLGMTEDEVTTISDERIEELHDYLHTVGAEKITSGLYTMGEPYGAADLDVTARLMAIDPITYGLAGLDAARGVIPDSLCADPSFIDTAYRPRANDMIDRILDGSATSGDFIDQADRARLDRWDAAHKTLTQDDFFAGMLSMGSGMSGAGDRTGSTDAYPRDCLEELVVRITADDRKREMVSGWRQAGTFEEASSLLDPESMDKAKKIAALIPAMKDMLLLIEDGDVHELLTAMQDSVTKETVFALMNDPSLADRREREAAILRASLLETARSAPYTRMLFAAAAGEAFADTLALLETAEVDSIIARLVFFRDHADLAADLAATNGQDEQAMAAILEHGSLVSDALGAAEREHAVREEREKHYVTLVRNLVEALDAVGGYAGALERSPARELDSIIDILNGGYLEPSPGGDPIASPRAVPTGRNLTAIDAETTPTAEAWSVGVDLAERTIREKLDATDEYPKKVAVSLWGGEFIRTKGVELAMIFYLLGVEPVRNSRGVVQDVTLIPAERLGRPRIDVVVQTSGQFRDIAASRIFLIDKAVKLASEANDPPTFGNHVHDGTLAAEAAMKRAGMSPLDARTFSTARVFGGVNGAYGTGITGMVEAGDSWESDTEIAGRYIENMGAVYTEDAWGRYEPGMFAGALQNTDTVVHSRSSNTWGPLSLDHVYEFMGGISAASRYVTGEDPDAYFSDLRNACNPVVESAKRAIWTETRTTMLNPKYIAALQEDGASAAETFAETFRNTYGWNVMKPSEIDEELWEGFYDVYVKDAYGLDMERYFREKNPYALQEMTAVMLETIRKGYWDADRDTRETLASLHASLVNDHEAGCSGFVCDNTALREFIETLVAPDLGREYAAAIDAARTGAAQEPVEGMVLEKESLTLDTVKKVIAENATALMFLAGIIVLFAAAVIFGARRRVS